MASDSGILVQASLDGLARVLHGFEGALSPRLPPAAAPARQPLLVATREVAVDVRAGVLHEHQALSLGLLALALLVLHPRQPLVLALLDDDLQAREVLLEEGP